MQIQNRGTAEIMAYRENTLRNAIAALGDTTADVVTKLTELGIKGLPNKASKCPIAVYLNTVYLSLSDHAVAMVSGYGITVDDCEDVRFPGVFILTPPAVSRFITEFDGGAHLQLRADLPAQ